jgi:hypothetical protein
MGPETVHIFDWSIYVDRSLEVDGPSVCADADQPLYIQVGRGAQQQPGADSAEANIKRFPTTCPVNRKSRTYCSRD